MDINHKLYHLQRIHHKLRKVGKATGDTSLISKLWPGFSQIKDLNIAINSIDILNGHFRF